MFSFFITKKFILSKKDNKSFSLFSIIAVAGIAIGVTALILSISILNGFEKLLTEKMINLDSHIQIVGFSNNRLDFTTKNQNTIKNILGNSLLNIQPYISSLAIINNKKNSEGLTIKGVKADYFNFVKDIRIISGNHDLPMDSKQMIIGTSLANKLSLKTGDKVNIFALTNNKIPSPENLPAIDKYVVSGIFESGFAKYDNNFAFVNISSASNFFNFSNQISGYEIKLNDISQIDSLTFELQDNLRYPHYITTVFQLYRHIFTWIELQKKPIPIILGLIIIVAVFNIISTLLMIVMEKINSIGVFKSLGVSNRKIGYIFLQHGIIIGFIGVLLGAVLSFILILIQLKFNIISLPAEIYFTSTVPLVLEPFVFLYISGISFILCILASVLPGYVASKLNTISILRFN